MKIHPHDITWKGQENLLFEQLVEWAASQGFEVRVTECRRCHGTGEVASTEIKGALSCSACLGEGVRLGG